MPFRYETYDSPLTGTIAQLMGANAQSQAEAIRAAADAQARAAEIKGRNTSQMLGTIGDLVQRTGQQIGQHYDEAPRREMEQLQLRAGRRNEASLAQEARLEQALTARLSDPSAPPPDVRELAAMGFGEQRALTIANDFQKLEDADLADEKRTFEKLGRQVKWVKALPAGMRQAPWMALRSQLVAAQMPAEAIPEQWDDAMGDALLAFTGQAPDKAEGFTLNPGDTRYDPTGKPIATAAPKPEQPKLREVTVRGPNGRPVRKLVPEADMLAGVEEYREPKAPPASEPLEAIMVNGEATFVPRSQAIGKTPATSRQRTTEDERKSVGWYQQMRDAAATIDQLEDQLTQKELFQIQSLPHESLMGMANRNQLSDAAKRYLRAFTQFSEARLRSVSGAAISTGEYQSDRQTYGKQFGETPNLRDDRKRAREVVIAATRERAGVAMPTEAPTLAVPPAVSDALKGQKDGRYTLSDGSVWNVAGGKASRAQ